MSRLGLGEQIANGITDHVGDRLWLRVNARRENYEPRSHPSVSELDWYVLAAWYASDMRPSLWS